MVGHGLCFRPSSNSWNRGVNELNDYQNKLTNFLLEKNDHISYWQAKIWVEFLWYDIEMSLPPNKLSDLQQIRATEKVIREWINQYGMTLHEFVHEHPKYDRFVHVSKKLTH